MNQFTYTTWRNVKFSFISTIASFTLLTPFLVAETTIAETTEAKSHKPVEKAISIGGYDPVAYYLEDKAIKGKEEHSYTWKGKTWMFSSESHKNKFEEAPSEYAPQYNGCCAYALSEGKILKGDPQIFRISDGKLYFFHDENKRSLFENDISKRFETADRNYVKMFSVKF